MDDELAAAIARITAKVWWMLPRSVKIESIEPFLRGKHQCIGVSVRRDGLVRATTEYWGENRHECTISPPPGSARPSSGRGKAERNWPPAAGNTSRRD